MISGSREYPLMVLLRSVFLCGHLSSMKPIKEVISEAVHIGFPQLFRQAAARILTEPTFGVPSKSTLSRAIFALDCALMLREQSDDRAWVRFGWADSSPQAGFDWLLSAHDQVLDIDLVRAARAVKDLCRERCREDAEFDEETVKANMGVLHACVHRRNDITVALGKGAVALEHKCGALLHKWWPMTGSRARVLQYRCSFAAYCTDLGTEVETADVVVDDVGLLMPSWLQHGEWEADTALADEEPDLHDDAAAASDAEPDIPGPAEHAHRKQQWKSVELQGHSINMAITSPSRVQCQPSCGAYVTYNLCDMDPYPP